MSILKMSHSALEINVDAIFKDIEAGEKRNRNAAVNHMLKAFRKNVSKKGVSKLGEFPGKFAGTLAKSFKKKDISDGIFGDKKTMFGTTDSKAHLLEWGHGDGKTKNKRPFWDRTILETEDEVLNILSKPYF